MRRAAAVPAELRVRPFLVEEGIVAGMSPRRLRGADVVTGVRGVRMLRFDGTSLPARCAVLQRRLLGRAHFSHSTAALLLGVPLPLSIERDPRLYITVLDSQHAPRIAGVVSHRAASDVGPVGLCGDLRVTSPSLTWCMLAEQLTVPDLVAAGDFLVGGAAPLATLVELESAVLGWAGRRGVRKLKQALALVRVGSRSRRESHARLLYVAAGIPEPKLNMNLYDAAGHFVAMVDLAWPWARVANEYESKYHQEGHQFRKDILRRERVEDIDWRLSRFTADDLVLRPAETVQRMARRLGMTLTKEGIAAAVAVSRLFGR